MIKRNENGPIDIIIPWVDGSDPEWQKEKTACLKGMGVDTKANSEIRYLNWNNLQYWFRAVEKFMPWVHRIFFVTWGHVPEFLNITHPKLEIVRHRDYIPAEYLPTFNSNTIEMNYHRIKGLAENFVLFNDDTFPLQPIKETYYFRNNQVCDQAVESPIMPVDIGDITRWSCQVKTNNILFINRHFKKREVQRHNFIKWFSPKYGERIRRNIGLHYWYNFAGFHDPHMPNAMKKSTLARLWETEPETLDTASRNQFRSESDLSQYLIRYWQLCSGEFIPRKTLGKPYFVTIDNCKKAAREIAKQQWQTVSLIEGCTAEEFEIIRKMINRALARILPYKSSFEI